jgi:hypothetical protein
MVDETGQQSAMFGQLEPERPAQRQVVLDRLAQRAHCAPAGHGRTTAANSPTSTVP